MVLTSYSIPRGGQRLWGVGGVLELYLGLGKGNNNWLLTRPGLLCLTTDYEDRKHWKTETRKQFKLFVSDVDT